MSKRIVSVTALVVALLIGFLLVWHFREPSYQGRTLTTWLGDAYDNGALYDQGPSEDTAIAVRGMGANAVPFLLDMVKAKDSIFRRALLIVSHKGWLPTHVRDGGELREMGIYGFVLLGSTGKAAVPGLVDCLRDNDLETRCSAADCLAAIEEPSPEAIAALLRNLERTEKPVSNGWLSEKIFDAYALGAMGPPALSAIPELAALTNSSVPFVSDSAELAVIRIQGQPLRPFFEVLGDTSNLAKWRQRATAVYMLGTNAAAALPYLIRDLLQTNIHIQCPAIYALGRVHSHPELCIPAIAPFLRSTNDLARTRAIYAICAFGRKAKPWVPITEMIRCLDDPDPTVRKYATNAVRFFDPEAAARAGIKMRPN